MKKPLLTTLSILLIAGGWFLEVYYYQYRFVGDGTPFTISIIIGATLTLLLTALFTMKSVASKIGRVALILLSVWFTWSGQNYAFNEKNNANSEKTTLNQSKQQLFNYYTEEVERLNNTITEKQEQIPKDIKQQTYLQTNGVKPLREEINKLTMEKQRYEKLLKDLIPDLSTSNNTNLSAYELLAKDIGLDSPTLLKTLSQLFLSLFIALMAPCGITILSTVYPQGKKKVEKKKESRVVTPKKDDIFTLYTNSRYSNSDKPVYLKGRTATCEETGMTQDKFNKISKLAIQLGLIVNSGNKHKPVVNKVQFEMMLRNKQKVVGRLRAVK